MIVFALIVLAAVVAVFMLSACKAAALADEQMERTFHEWLASQPKEVLQDASLAES